ncbi:putative isochorismatase family protein [uncultured archaeon]|nr:putative isochorismatase family protein [uncultured archaeon]
MALEEWRRDEGVSRVAVCGYMTQMCGDTTARRAFHLGFQVDFLSDATGTLSVRNCAGFTSDRDLHRWCW